ncbi:MAG: glycoside hydrolase family 3 C-terminal domain-containing protein, partial [Actinomycetota bacterium]
MTADALNTETGTSPASERSLIAALSVEEKVLLLTGADSWRTQGAEALGLRPMITSDGPAGVRGVVKDERSPSSSLPCPAALGATWDPGLVHELACALGAEARGKGVDVLLGPTINLMRTPLGGRGFECFAEDPVLTAAIAMAYVRGVQSAGVAATVKHYVANDSETERWTYDARISKQVLRELYLLPFEACVREAGAMLVMAAYNMVNGSPMTEHEHLLKEVLKGEWGFDGIVISDWHAARSTAATALAALDLSMPGPDGPWGDLLARAVADGAVDPEVLDDKLVRLLRLARRVGALRGSEPAGGTGSGLIDPGLLRRATAASFVLLRNEQDALPLDPAVRRIALVGPNAFQPTIQGGGSAGVVPVSVSTPADGLTAALAGQAEVTMAPGCRTWVMVPAPAAGSLRDPETGEPGLRLQFLAPDGSQLLSECRSSTSLAWWDGVPPGIGWGENGRIVLEMLYRPDVTGPHLIGAAGVGRLVISVDGTVAADEATRIPADPVEAMTRPGEVRATAVLQAGQEATVQLVFTPAANGEGPLAVALGIVAQVDEDQLIADAVQAAAVAVAAVVLVGSAAMTESEGFDRATLALPGRQDELVRAVAAVNSRTVVVINAGMPVLMPWAGEVAAVLYAWLPGQAMGEALADVLLGTTEPGGRLPVTMPAREEDSPVLHAVPEDGVLDYA